MLAGEGGIPTSRGLWTSVSAGTDVVNIVQSKSLRISVLPLVVVEKTPCEIATHIDTVSHSTKQFRQVALVVVDSEGVVYHLISHIISIESK